MNTETQPSYTPRDIPQLLAENLIESGITDIDVYDLVSDSSARLRELMFAIGTLPSSGCEIDDNILDPLTSMGGDEARKIISVLRVWRDQKKADAIAIRERISAIMTALYTLEEALFDKGQEIDRDQLLQAVYVGLWVLSSENEGVLSRFLGYENGDLDTSGNTFQIYNDARRARLTAV